jgi:hypothetical protein
VQFKPVGNRIQLVAYRGYDQEKRRAIVKVLGSIDAYSLVMRQCRCPEVRSYLSREVLSNIEEFF